MPSCSLTLKALLPLHPNGLRHDVITLNFLLFGRIDNEITYNTLCTIGIAFRYS